MVDDWVIKTMYATKRRRKNPKTNKPTCSGGIRPEQNVKSNPSKRHRERLNSELEHLASLLPFEQNVIVKLDKLSILRLAVSYLRIKCYFHALSFDRLVTENRLVSHLYHCPFDLTRIEGEACLQALNGFIFIMSCDGEVFSVSKTVEHYLGFHQADILHQSVLELIHSEDREEFRRQLSWRSMLSPELQPTSLHDLMSPENAHYLKRRFTVRFRCLLDNTSGFITLELSGRLQFLHGQARSMQMAANSGQINPSTNINVMNKYSTPNSFNSGSTSSQHTLPPLGLFAVCSPLGPLPSLNGPQRDATFKTKHQLDLTVITIDARARLLFNYSDADLQNFKVYDLVHPDDLRYVAKGHKELFKVGSLGLLVHRWLNKQSQWVWLQSRIKLIMKSGKQDHIIVIHRQLSNEEGMELLIRRTDEYKLPFPLLEPETLLNGEELSASNTTSHMDINSTFPMYQMKHFDHHLIGSSDQKLYGTNIKSDKINLGSKHTAEKVPNSDICADSIGFNPKRANCRQLVDVVINNTQGERCLTRTTLDNYGGNLQLPGVESNLLEHCLNKSGRQSKVIQTTVRRRKRTVKEMNTSEVNKCRLNHRGSCTTACIYMSSEQMAGQINYGANIYPPAYLPLSFNQTLPRSSESFCRNPYLCWPTNNTTTAMSTNLGLNKLDNSDQFPQYDSSKMDLFMTDSQHSNQDIRELGIQDHYPNRNYPTAYDAYSAAVAAAAVVAAATGSCNSKQQSQNHPSLPFHQQYQSQNSLNNQTKQYKRHCLSSSHFLTNDSESEGQHFQQTLNDANLFDLQKGQQSQAEYNSPLRNEHTVISSSLQSTFNSCADYILSNNYFSQEQQINNQIVGRGSTESSDMYIKEFLKPGLSNIVQNIHHSQMNIKDVKSDINSVNNHNNVNILGQSLTNYTSMNPNNLFAEDFRSESTDEQKDSSSNMYLHRNIEQRIIYANTVIDKESSSAYSSYSSPPNLTSPHNNEVNLETDSSSNQKPPLQMQTPKIMGMNSQFDDPSNNRLISSECHPFYESARSSNWIPNTTHTSYKPTEDFISDDQMTEIDCGQYQKNLAVTSLSLSMDSSNSSRSPTPRDSCINQDEKLIRTGTEQGILYYHSSTRHGSWSCRQQSSENTKFKVAAYPVTDFGDHKQNSLNSSLMGSDCSEYDSTSLWNEHPYESSKTTTIPVPVVCTDPLDSFSNESSQTHLISETRAKTNLPDYREGLLNTI
ncbi:unnamed protein product [Trichobilharzia szidati]|nr:unnamed protein product [Trichobilharzia szidati]